MEELKARILEIVEDYEKGISVLDNDMAQAGIDPKSDFVNTIEQLLEERECRAREEGRREQQKLDCELYGTAVATDEEVEEMWKTKLERMRDKAEKELDKLSNK